MFLESGSNGHTADDDFVPGDNDDDGSTGSVDDDDGDGAGGVVVKLDGRVVSFVGQEYTIKTPLPPSHDDDGDDDSPTPGDDDAPGTGSKDWAGPWVGSAKLSVCPAVAAPCYGKLEVGKVSSTELSFTFLEPESASMNTTFSYNVSGFPPLPLHVLLTCRISVRSSCRLRPSVSA